MSALAAFDLHVKWPRARRNTESYGARLITQSHLGVGAVRGCCAAVRAGGQGLAKRRGWWESRDEVGSCCLRGSAEREGEGSLKALADRDGDAVHDDRGHDKKVDNRKDDSAQALTVVLGQDVERDLGVEDGPDADGTKVARKNGFLPRWEGRNEVGLWQVSSAITNLLTRRRTQGSRRKSMTVMPNITKRHGVMPQKLPNSCQGMIAPMYRKIACSIRGTEVPNLKSLHNSHC